MIVDQFDIYLEKMLSAQFEASELFENNLTKGEAREDFITNQIIEQFGHLHVRKGHLFDNNDCQSGQCDLIICKKDVRSRKLGFQSLVDIEHADMILEVKSNATYKDFEKANKNAEKIKKLISENKPLFGMFCYRLSVDMKKILKKFNYSFIELYDTYKPNYFLENKYPNIDFVLSLHQSDDEETGEVINKQFFIIKENAAYGNYVLYQDPPISKYFFRLLSK